MTTEYATPAGALGCVDINGDGTITSADISAMQAQSGKVIGTPGFNYLADLTQDGGVVGSDVVQEYVDLNEACLTTRDRYTYDGNGTLIKREHLVQSAGDWTTQSWTVYIGGVYEMHSDGSVTKYYSGAGRTIAIRSVPSTGGAGALSFPVTDHLGSTRALLDSSGAPAGTATYWPYGATRPGATGALAGGTPPSGTDRLYTGQRMEAGDPALGLYNYNARFYSTTLGAFVSADTVGDGLNRYEYVHGNPLRYTDPSGHCAYGLRCTWQDAQNWIRCALSCGDNVFGILARAALASNEGWKGGDSFWQRFSVAYMEGGHDNVALFEVIGASATTGSLHALFTNDKGGNYLASIFGAGYRSHYFEASLSDVLFGTRRVAGLGISDVEGASAWSDSIFWPIRMRTQSHQNSLSMSVIARLSDVPSQLAQQTLSVAEQNSDSDLNQRQWTMQQRAWLHDSGFPEVTIPLEETSIFQIAAEGAADCVTDVECINTWAGGSDWERDLVP